MEDEKVILHLKLNTTTLHVWVMYHISKTLLANQSSIINQLMVKRPPRCLLDMLPGKLLLIIVIIIIERESCRAPEEKIFWWHSWMNALMCLSYICIPIPHLTFPSLLNKDFGSLFYFFFFDTSTFFARPTNWDNRKGHKKKQTRRDETRRNIHTHISQWAPK